MTGTTEIPAATPDPTTGPTFSQTPPLEPIRTTRRVRFLEDEQLDRLQDATLHVLETVGVRFPNQRSLEILGDHGAKVDQATQIVRFPRHLVRTAMATGAARVHHGRPQPSLRPRPGGGHVLLHDGRLRGRGHRSRHRPRAAVTQGGRRPAWRGWPTTCRPSASCGRRSGPRTWAARRSCTRSTPRTTTRSSTSRAWSWATRRPASPSRWRPSSPAAARPCAPGRSSRTSSAPSRPWRRTMPASSPRWSWPRPASRSASSRCRPWARRRRPPSAGAFVVGDAEVISGIVLLQLAYPGTPVFHSIMKAYADPRTGELRGLLARQRRHPLRAGRDGTSLGRPVAGSVLRDRLGSGRHMARGGRRRAGPAARRPLGRGARHGHGPRPHVHADVPGGHLPRQRAVRAGALRAHGREGRRRDAGAGRHRGCRAGRALPGGGAHPEAHEDGAQARPRARPGQRAVPGPGRGCPRTGGVGPGEPPPGAAWAPPNRPS